MPFTFQPAADGTDFTFQNIVDFLKKESPMTRWEVSLEACGWFQTKVLNALSQQRGVNGEGSGFFVETTTTDMDIRASTRAMVESENPGTKEILGGRGRSSHFATKPEHASAIRKANNEAAESSKPIQPTYRSSVPDKSKLNLADCGKESGRFYSGSRMYPGLNAVVTLTPLHGRRSAYQSDDSSTDTDQPSPPAVRLRTHARRRLEIDAAETVTKGDSDLDPQIPPVDATNFSREPAHPILPAGFMTPMKRSMAFGDVSDGRWSMALHRLLILHSAVACFRTTRWCQVVPGF